MGAITKRADGRYVTTVTVAPGKRKSVYGKTRKDCAENLKTLERQIEQGVITGKKPRNVRELLDIWLASIATKRKLSTMQGYKQIVKNHLVPHLGNIALDKLSPEHVQTMIDKLEKTHSALSVRNFHARLRKALNFALMRGYIPYNPATRVELPPTTHAKVQPFTIEQAKALLEAVTGHPLEVLYRMAFVMGFREGELCALLWEETDLDKMEIHITGTIRRIDGKLQRLRGAKNDASTTTVPIPATITQRLIPLRKTSGYVFATKNGTPYEPSNLYKHFKALVDKANQALADEHKIPTTATFHAIRHSTASFLIAQGVHPRMVMEHLRHSQISVTLNTYAHIFKAEHRSTGDQLGSMLE
jgi:integrase